MNDPISRQAAIDDIKAIYEYHDTVTEDRIIDHLKRLPTAEKVGKWTRHILKNANVPLGYDCSACGEWFVIGEDTAERYNYCPNCGARMKGEADE